MRLWYGFLAVLAVMASATSASAGFIVSSAGTNSILDYNLTGGFQGTLVTSGSGGINAPHGMLLTSDGRLLVTGNQNNISAFDAHTGASLGIFASGGGLSIARGLALAPDGSFLVSSYGTGQILRYNSTGAFSGVFASGAGLSGPAALLFGPDGMLYVNDFNRGAVDRFDANGAPAPAAGQTGATFVASGSGGLLFPNMGLAFAPNGSLVVGSFGTNSVLDYDPVTGAFLGSLVGPGSGGLQNPQGLLFGPNGSLYVTSEGNNRVLRFDGSTGAYQGDLVTSGSGGLNTPTNILFEPAQAVPEPASIVTLAIGLISVAGFTALRRGRLFA